MNPRLVLSGFIFAYFHWILCFLIICVPDPSSAFFHVNTPPSMTSLVSSFSSNDNHCRESFVGDIGRGGSNDASCSPSSNEKSTSPLWSSVQNTNENKKDDAAPSSLWQTIKSSFQSLFKSRDDPTLKKGIADFYDESSAIWEEVWGEHMHHGYYYTGKEKDHIKAQSDMIEESLSFAGVTESAAGENPNSSRMQILDVGCGIGGSSRHIAKKFNGESIGITLSPFQRGRAEDITEKAGMGHQSKFQVADAMNMPFEDSKFDLVWSMESGEHMPDKKRFLQELQRVAKKKHGKMIVVTWCHRNLAPGEKLKPLERILFRWINNIYQLPPWVSIEDYTKIANDIGWQNIKVADWTDQVKPFWPAVLLSSLSWKGIKECIRNRTVREGAFAIVLMMMGYSIGLIRFGIITGTAKE